MKIDILTLFPEMFDGFKQTSIIARSINSGLVEVNTHDFREFALNKHKKVDDYPYGGGQGMVLQCQPVIDCIKTLKSDQSVVMLMCPTGQSFNQELAKRFSSFSHLIIVCGHYEGYDERIREYCDIEVSIGDYVLTGGELGSMVVSDAIIRLLEGSINQSSHEDDSFSNGLLEFPQYTRPALYEDKQVPDVLLSGHHENIRRWRLYESLKKTYKKRPDLLKNRDFSQEELVLLEKAKKNIDFDQ